MKIIDTHCDVLYKMQKAKRSNNELLKFRTSSDLEASMERLNSGGVSVQFFAIFVDPSALDDEKWALACEQIELFHTEVIGKNSEMRHIRNWSHLAHLQEDEIGAILSLEGVEPIGDDLSRLTYLYEQGVLSVGLTWNKANLAADGALERNHGGLTHFGEHIIALNNERGVLTDVSHLSERSFWGVLHQAEYVFASHSNVRTLCDHPRNLSDIQLRALFVKGGIVNVTFYPPFIEEEYKKRRVTTDDIMRHIAYICSLGGVDHVGFGSDFDGIDLYIDDLRHAAQYKLFVNKLQRYFSRDQIRGFAGDNFMRFISQVVGGIK